MILIKCGAGVQSSKGGARVINEDALTLDVESETVNGLLRTYCTHHITCSKKYDFNYCPPLGYGALIVIQMARLV